MAYRTLESVLHPDSHLSLPTAELPQRPIRVMVTMMEDDAAESLADIGDCHVTLRNNEELLARKTARIRSPRLVHPEQAADFAVEVIEVTDDARV